MASAAAILLAIIKALPAAESLFAQVLAAYTAWKIEQNLADEKFKNERNTALVAAALAAPPPSGLRDDLCATCPARLGRG